MSNYIVSDTSLSSIADAIREKTGSSEQLVFPNGFVSEIGNITGGITITETEDTHGGTVKNIVAVDLSEDTVDAEHLASGYTAHDKDGNAVVGIMKDFDANAWVDGTFTPKKIVFNANLNGKSYIFSRCPFEEIVWTYESTGNINTSSRMFLQSPNLKIFVATSFLGAFGSASVNAFDSCTSLEKVDWSGSGINGNMFTGCSSLNILILRRSSSIVSIGNNSFSNSSFASGGTGGTIYIPKVLYDELGTGSSLDYKAATNWSTYDGYGTITWAKIEGSIYENAYADGTPIPSN